MRFWSCSLAVLTWLFALAASAQQPFTGCELALSGDTRVVAGQPAQIRGTAYRVRGLAELVRFPRAQIEARFSRGRGRPAEPWVRVNADPRGDFEIAVPIPNHDVEHAALEVRVSEGDQSRTFQFSLHVQSALDVLLRTDRVLYERGETIHVWALIRERGSLRPLAGEVAEVMLEGPAIGQIRRSITTGEDGVVSLDVPIGPSAQEGAISVRMSLRGETFRTEARVGSRNYARMLAHIRALPELAAPHAPVTIEVEVSTPSGAPISNAEVRLRIDGQLSFSGTTGQDGIARIEAHAPAYLTHDTGSVVLFADVQHPAYGAATAQSQLQLAVPLTLRVEAVARLGALVPEVDDVLYVLLSDARGNPPSGPTEVEVTGAAVRGGRALVMTDAHGIAEVPVRLPQGAWGSGRVTTVRVRVHGALEQTARLPIDVRPDAEVAPHVRRPVTEPGARFDVEIVRGPSARNKSLVVELLDELRVLATRHLGPHESRTSFDAPMDRLGLLAVRARAIHEDEVWEGSGAIDRVLVRPARPTFASLRAERTEYLVGETARVSLQTTPGDRGFAALLVRDIAAHGGEEPFQYRFLRGAFDESILAATPEAERLVRTAFAARALSDPKPLRASPLLDALGLPADASNPERTQLERGVLRDPFPLARELERRGIAVWMHQAEEALANAIASDALSDITISTGSSRRFRSEILEGGETLGRGPIDIAYIEAVDPSFRYETVARRVARAQLVKVLSALSRYLDPGDDASIAARMAARESPERWLPRMIERGLITEEDLRDPWGGRFTLRRAANPIFVLSARATNLELVSPGPDGRLGTADDLRDPFARVVPAGTPYAVASGEDELMRQLALLSPASRTIAAISEAYTRITAEMTEDEIGDAVQADASEGALGFGGLGMSGSGTGGGGTGYGYGSGALRGQRHRRGGSAETRRGALLGLARVMRERFPATLVFRPSIALDPSGVTELSIPLADAVTSYLVEVIVWRPDGWAWSAETRISVVREIVVDAPVPEVARIGDEITLPIRVSNRASANRELVIHMLGAPELGIPADDPRTVSVAAQSGAVAFFTIRPSRVGQGQLRVAVSDAHGHALDAITHPLFVSENSRRARSHAEALVIGQGQLTLTIPEGASPEDAEIVITDASTLFDAPSHDWITLVCTTREPARIEARAQRGQESSTARNLAVDWFDTQVSDETIASALRDLTQELEAIETNYEARARVLLDLSPLARNIEARQELAHDANLLVSELRRSVASGAAASSDLDLFAFAAAALAWTHPSADPRAREMLRRIEPSIVSLGEERFVASPNHPMSITALVAMAHAALGASDRAHLELALSLLHTVARWSSRGGFLSQEAREFAAIALARMNADAGASSAEITIGETMRSIELIHGAGRLELDRLAPGVHRAGISISGHGLHLVRISASYRLPWEEQRGPFSITTLGEPEGLDRTADFTLVLRNRTARTLAEPILEIDLPTGAEISESARSILASLSASPPEHQGNVLTLRLRSMPPGVERRVHLPLRLTVSGQLPGLGVAAYAADRPEIRSVTPPRTLRVEGGAR